MARTKQTPRKDLALIMHEKRKKAELLEQAQPLPPVQPTPVQVQVQSSTPVVPVVQVPIAAVPNAVAPAPVMIQPPPQPEVVPVPAFVPRVTAAADASCAYIAPPQTIRHPIVPPYANAYMFQPPPPPAIHRPLISQPSMYMAPQLVSSSSFTAPSNIRPLLPPQPAVFRQYTPIPSNTIVIYPPNQAPSSSSGLPPVASKVTKTRIPPTRKAPGFHSNGIGKTTDKPL